MCKLDCEVVAKDYDLMTEILILFSDRMKLEVSFSLPAGAVEEPGAARSLQLHVDVDRRGASAAAVHTRARARHIEPGVQDTLVLRQQPLHFGPILLEDVNIIHGRLRRILA